MNISPKTYAKILLESLQESKNESAALENFVRVVAKTGGVRKFPKVVRAVEEVVIRKNGGRVIMTETARPFTKKQETELRSQFSPKDHLEIAVRPELVAGIRIVIDGEEAIDNTLRRKLEKLFT